MNEIIRLCEEIKDNKKCSGCGASKYDGCECIYCGSINEKLKVLVDKLISALNNTTDFDNKILVSLLSINDLGIKKANSILNKYDVNTIVSSKYKWLLDNKFGSNISKDDEELFINLIDSNSIDTSTKNTFITILMRYMITGNLSTSNDKKKLLIKKFTEMYMETRIKNPECIYSKLDDANGDAFYSLIRLNDNTIDNYLRKGLYAQILMLVFHECTHTYQKYYMHNGEILSYLLLLQTKETIIRNRSSNYYDDNYKMFSEESEARYMEYKGLLDYLSVLNLGLSKENTEFCNNMMQEEYKNCQDENRVLDGKNTTVDEIFDNIELTISELNRYPLLKLEYKIEDDRVAKKSIEELENDYAYLKSVKTGEEREQIDYIYSKLIKERVNKK